MYSTSTTTYRNMGIGLRGGEPHRRMRQRVPTILMCHQVRCLLDLLLCHLDQQLPMRTKAVQLVAEEVRESYELAGRF